MKNQDRDRTTKKQDEDDEAIVAGGRQDGGLSTPSAGRGRVNDDVIDEDDDTVEPGTPARTRDSGRESPTTRKK